MVLTSNVWYWLATVLAETWLQQFLITLQWSLRSTVDGIFLELRYVVVKLRTENCLMQNINSCYLALINRAGGLYGRILTEVVSTDRTQWGLYTWPRSGFSHTDRLSSVNKMFIIWQKQERLNSFNVTYWFVLTDILLANGDKPNFILPNFARPLYFFSHQLFATYRKKYS